jgi:hypothetical protein
MPVSFTTTLRQAHTKNATAIQVPQDIVDQLAGGKAHLVKVMVNGYSYRGKIAVYGDENLIGFSAEYRDATGLKGGDPIEVSLEPRTVEIPADLKVALEQAGIVEKFEASAPSRKKEYVRQVEEAKAADTRTRRIEKIVADLL